VERGQALQRVKDSKLSPSEFILGIRKIWNKILWNSEFGGPIFEKITDCYLRLKSAKNLELFAEIDKVLDLEHNTGTIFKKIPCYNDEGNGYFWIKEFLDMKRDLKNPWELYEYVSETKKIAPKKLKELGFGTKTEIHGTVEYYGPSEIDITDPLGDVRKELESIVACMDQLRDNSNNMYEATRRNEDAFKGIRDVLLEMSNQQSTSQLQFKEALVSEFKNLKEILRVLIDTAENNAQITREAFDGVADQLQKINEAYSEQVHAGIEHLAAHVTANRVHIEKYMKLLDDERLKHVEDIEDRVRDDIAECQEFAERQYELFRQMKERMERPWWIKIRDWLLGW
jgi:hypothetical protein